MTLKRVITKAGLRQAHLARHLGVSPGTLSDAVNHGKWPKGKPELRRDLKAHLIGAGVPASLQAWERGRFIRFHGVAQWIGWLWPYAVLLHLLRRVVAREDDRG